MEDKEATKLNPDQPKTSYGSVNSDSSAPLTTDQAQERTEVRGRQPGNEGGDTGEENQSGNEGGDTGEENQDPCCKQATWFTPGNEGGDTGEENQVPCWKQIVGVGIILIGIFQAFCSSKRWVKIHECHEEIVNATNNSSQVYDSYYNFTATLYGFFAILHAVAERQILIDIPFKKCCNMHLKTEIKSVYKKILCLKLKCRFLLICLVIVILFLLSSALIVTGILYDLKYDNCSYDRPDTAFIICYHVLVLFTTLVIDIVLCCLIIATVHVCHTWKLQDDFVHELKPEEYDCNDDSKLKRKASLFYSQICCDYYKKGKKVIQFTSPFEAWFVLQWFIYFLGIFIDLTYVLRPWILGGRTGVHIYQHHVLEYVNILIFTVYDIIVFILPFAFGVMMSNSHHRYYKKLVQEQENVFGFLNKRDENGQIEERLETRKEKNCALGYALITAVLKVPKVEEYDFTPSIFGVDIPLRNPGYILSIILAMIALILGILVNPLN